MSGVDPPAPDRSREAKPPMATPSLQPVAGLVHPVTFEQRAALARG
jgi:hypothetical protein